MRDAKLGRVQVNDNLKATIWGVAVVPPLSDKELTAHYTTHALQSVDTSHIIPYAIKPNGESSVELPSVTLSVSDKSKDLDGILDELFETYAEAWDKLAKM